MSNPKGKSSVQLAADLGITQKSAWHLSHRIRRVLEEGCLPNIDGPIEVDETYIGGKERNRHADRSTPERRSRRSGSWTAPAARPSPCPSMRSPRASPRPSCGRAPKPGWRSTPTAPASMTRLPHWAMTITGVIHTIGECVRDGITTNQVENFWLGLKRFYIGTHHW